MMTAHTHQGRERRHHPQKSIHPHGQEIHLQKKENIIEEPPPPQRYTVTEQNDDVTDGILGGRLLRIELWNMK